MTGDDDAISNRNSSLHGLEVIDDLGALLLVRDAGKRHHVAGNRLLRVGEKAVEGLVVPGQAGLAHRRAVAEALAAAGLAAVDAFEARPDTGSAVDAVAGGAGGKGRGRVGAGRAGENGAGEYCKSGNSSDGSHQMFS